jgi:hypothetical protein
MLQTFIRSPDVAPALTGGAIEAIDPILVLSRRAAAAAIGPIEDRGRLGLNPPGGHSARETIMRRIDGVLLIGTIRAANAARSCAHRANEAVRAGRAEEAAAYIRALEFWTRLAERRRARFERHRAAWKSMLASAHGRAQIAEIESRARPRGFWTPSAWTLLID